MRAPAADIAIRKDVSLADEIIDTILKKLKDDTIDVNRALQEKNILYEIISHLEQKGYAALEVLGAGRTRAAILQNYSSGGVNKLRVTKVPLDFLEGKSICTIINKSKRDVDENEVSISNELSHPALIEVLDSFKIFGRKVNVEANTKGDNLEERVISFGPLNDDMFYKTFNQILDLYQYLNIEKKILDRDTKPSNFIITPDGHVKKTDLQNAVRLDQIKETAMPTRGGTPYTHPKLLNALVTGKPEKAGLETEKYSLAATMYFALTGDVPFDYQIRITNSADKGHQISVKDKTYSIDLLVNGKPVDMITEDMHEQILKEALKKVQKRYRKLLRKGLTLQYSDSYYSVEDLRKGFEKLKKPNLNDFMQTSLKAVRPILYMGVGAALLLAVGTTNHKYRKELAPTLKDIVVQKASHEPFTLENLKDPEREYVLDILEPHMKEAKEKLPIILSEHVQLIDEMAEFAERDYNMPKRLISSWLKATYLIDNKKINREFDNKRLGQIFVPYEMAQLDFPVDRANTFHGPGTEKFYIEEGIRYLKMCMGQSNDVADILANYYTTNGNINIARARTQSVKFLPNLNNHSMILGYNSALPRNTANLIEKTLALYLLTDEEGKTDFSKIPKRDPYRRHHLSDLSLP